MTEARKIHLAKGNVQRPPEFRIKASGDAGGKSQARHKNKNKIPKSLRYDLENALVGLCDVWFEEIKPYLVHNNVKVHVHDSEAGDGDREAPAPECSHLDPGRPHQRQRRSAGFAGCYSTPPTASRARFHRPPSQPVSSLRPDRSTESPNCKKEPKKSRRRKREPLSQSPPRQLVPRLCRTYSIPPYNILIQPVVNNNNIGVHMLKPLKHNQIRYPSPKLKKTKDASTQTERRVKIQVTRLQDKTHSQEDKQDKSQSIKKFPIKVNVVKTESKDNQPRSPQFRRCQAATTFFSPNIPTKISVPALFQDDLINIISEKHDKKLKILYTSPVQDEYPSIMNLYSPTCNIITSKKTDKAPPWR